MLAEPRRRQKWSSDPRGESWSKDDSKFGQKMLEKMGWQKGKGLGAKEDGMTQHVKASRKFDQTGLGCSSDQADNWIAHQEDFDALLAGLNANHGDSNSGEVRFRQQGGEERPLEQTKAQQAGLQATLMAETNTKTISMEEKSKSSKRRVHYHKFTRGKDLSSMSQADLACIMGKKSSQSEPATPNQSEPATPRNQSDAEDEDSATSCPTPTNSYGVTTITQSQSIQDYFAQKMAELKRQRSNGEVKGESCDAEGQSSHPESTSDQQSKKKSKKRKSEVQEDNISSESEGVMKSSSLQKKKKRKHKEDSSELAEMETSSQLDSRKEKKKKRKKEKELLEPQQEVLEELGSRDEKLKKKKKKSRDIKSEEASLIGSESIGLETVEDGIKRKKKKKKSKKEKLQQAD